MGVQVAIVNRGATLLGPTADGSAGQVLETDGAGNLSFVDPGAGAEIISGTYTGDGTTSQVISAGFTDTSKVPQLVRIYKRDTIDGNIIEVFDSTPDIVDDTGAGGAFRVSSNEFKDNRIIALAANTFTVDDDGFNADPNASGQVYNFIVIG